MTEVITDPKNPSSGLKEATEDRIKTLVKNSVSESVADLIEARLKTRGATLEAKHEAQLKAAFANKQYRELTKDTPVFGAMAWAQGRAILSKGSKTAMEFFEQAVGEGITKTLSLSDTDSGGILIQGEVLDLFYEPLRAQAVVLAANPEEVPLVADTVSLSGWESDPTITWVGEPNVSEVTSEPTSGAKALTAKHAMVLVPVSLDLVNAPGSPRVLRSLEDLVRKAFRNGFDLQLITGAGTAHAPKGLRNWAGNSVGTTGQTLAAVLADFEAALTAMQAANVPMMRVAVFMAPRSKNHLMLGALNADNEPVLREEIQGGTFLGFPLGVTSQIVTNLGGGGNESYILIADMSEVVVGMGEELELDSSTEASYTVSGATRNAFERREQLLRGHQKIDMQVPHDDAVYEITGVLYGT